MSSRSTSAIVRPTSHPTISISVLENRPWVSPVLSPCSEWLLSTTKVMFVSILTMLRERSGQQTIHYPLATLACCRLGYVRSQQTLFNRRFNGLSESVELCDNLGRLAAWRLPNAKS